MSVPEKLFVRPCCSRLSPHRFPLLKQRVSNAHQKECTTTKHIALMPAQRRTKKAVAKTDIDDEEDIISGARGVTPEELTALQLAKQEVLLRKSDILLILAKATPTNLESLLREYQSELDMDMLDLLYKRIEVAERFDEVLTAF